MSSDTTVEKQDIERIFLGLAVEAQQQIPSSLHRDKKRVIILAGPTGCGKSDFAIQLAQAVHGEIISGDSVQIYRGMDIGTAKVSSQEREVVPHHLLDIREIHEPFNVVDFYFEARYCCQEILNRGDVPIVVGGSGFYVHSLIYGPPSGPPPNKELRKILEKEFETLGGDVLYERLKQLDQEYARSIMKNDRQKIIRALEIITLTGKKVSQLSWKSRKKPQNYDFRCWFLHRPKEHLNERIEERCERMLDQGFLEEVNRLISLGIKENPSTAHAVGYRQALGYLETAQTPEDFAKFKKDFFKASRHYAKRQMTWFRKEPLFRWIDLDMHDFEVAIDAIVQDYHQGI